MRRAPVPPLVAICGGLSVAVACAAGRPDGAALDARFIAVHNALDALGLSQVGPIHQGALAEGREARVRLDLPVGCTTIVSIGAGGVRDLGAALVDAQGQPVAHDASGEPEATLRACVDHADAYVLVLKAKVGSGTWVAATWQGGGAGGAPAAVASGAAAVEATGTCASPIPLATGTTSGSTSRGEAANAGSCEKSDAREIVYELDVPSRQRVTFEVEARFDSVLYIRKDDCLEETAEVDCNDDAPGQGRNFSRIERVLEPGKYFVFVDGYAQEGGSYKLTVSASEVVALSESCRRAPLLAAGVVANGTTSGHANDAHATCGDGADGADMPFRLELSSRSRVRVVEHSDEINPVVHVRRVCADDASEEACGESAMQPGAAAVTSVLDPGTYAVFADARERDGVGRYDLLLETSPPDGTGSNGDGCGDALHLGHSPVLGDTFAAHDDVAGSCGGAGAGDVVYRVDVPHRARFVAGLQAEESTHVLTLWKRCGDRTSEMACGPRVDEVLPPGTYFVSVDGASPDQLGAFSMTWELDDLAAESSACASAPKLVEGRVFAGTTVGAADQFSSSCVSGGVGGSGSDRVFQFTLDRRASIDIALTASFDAILALRRACNSLSGGPRGIEVACESGSDVGQTTVIKRTLAPGTYWVVVDGASANDQGTFSLEYRTTARR